MGRSSSKAPARSAGRKWTRRAFMVGGAATAGGLVLGIGFLAGVDVRGLTPNVGKDGQIDLNAWVRITPDNQILFQIPRTEMGQGIHTALPMLIAEELGIDLSAENVSVQHPTDALPVYANFVLALNKRPEQMAGAADWLGKRVFGLVPYIATGGSTSVVDAYEPLRRAGATARTLLEDAAARRWGVIRAEVVAAGGTVREKSGGRSATYGELALAAAAETPDETVPLKLAKNFSVIGRDHARLDIPDKVTGTAKFGIDTRPSRDMLFAVIQQSPVFGGRLVSYDSEAARSQPGVIDVVALEGAVAVVAETTWHAKEGLLKLEAIFSGGSAGAERFDSAVISEILTEALENGESHVGLERGDTADTPASSALTLEYETPYLAHACMEPMNCTATVSADGKAELWSSSQAPLSMLWGAAREGVVTEVTAHTTLTGGGFGRRSELDVGAQAAQIAAQIKTYMPGRAVQLIWSREEDIQHDMYRPAAKARIAFELGADGLPSSLHVKAACQSVANSFSKRNLPVTDSGLSDPANLEGIKDTPYDFPAIRVAAHPIDVPVPVGYWRSVGHSNNAFFMESAVDEMAHAAGVDPFDYRLKLLGGHKRLTPLMEKLRTVSGWDNPLPLAEENGAVRARGVALHHSFRTYVGQVVDLLVTPDKRIKVVKVTCVTDCGQLVNPNTVKAQMEGGIIFGLSAAVMGEITIEKGRVVQSNFPDYDMVRLRESPQIEVHLMQNGEAPGGVGEPGLPPLAPALVNALFAATGDRVRRLPLAKSGYYFL